jgi:hypothetical protein
MGVGRRLFPVSGLLVAREVNTAKEKQNYSCAGYEGVWESTGIAPLILNLRARWK